MPVFCLCRQITGHSENLHLVPGENTIGSLPDNHIVLSESGVSRSHAALVVSGSSIVLEDRASKNGSFVNGKQVRSRNVEAGDILVFGDCELLLVELETDDAALAIELQIDPLSAAEIRPEAETTRISDIRGSAEFATATHTTAAMSQILYRRGDGAPDFSGALAVLCQTLRAPAAWLLEAEQAEERGVVLATHGAIGSEFSRQISDLFREAIRGETMKTDSRVTTLHLSEVPAIGGLLMTEGEALSLWLAEIEADPGIEDLLRTALFLFALARGRVGAYKPSPLVPSDESLAWPEGYVPGSSRAIQELYQQMRAVAKGDLPVLILGETGVGKELVARIIHDSSPRCDGPFVAVNCAAIPKELLEAELFGVEKGAATGVAGRIGTFQKAHRGTLFLDEIGDMSSDLQAKLLRALQEQEICPVGGSTTKIDVRIVAATNIDLESKIDAGVFRADLYYRLAGCALKVPPLRQRREDIADLVEYFMRLFAAEISKPIRGMTVKAFRTLIDYDWPGNVRELEHEIRRLVYMCSAGQVIDGASVSELKRHSSASLPSQVQGGESGDADTGTSQSLSELDVDGYHLESIEKRVIIRALDAAGGKKVAAARLLGISRDTLRRRLVRHGLFETAP